MTNSLSAVRIALAAAGSTLLLTLVFPCTMGDRTPGMGCAPQYFWALLNQGMNAPGMGISSNFK
ncbi:hypothetical protein NDA07_23035 [Microcoleus vaginatus DQ-U2]|uniref:hypothetical protein n=1 Tax=Microcoleus vaginatus TaxID=119532 RepID=UPI00168699E2|nr:hypothetical protein [Microcoleus sp. FACHB-DQ6]